MKKQKIEKHENLFMKETSLSSSFDSVLLKLEGGMVNEDYDRHIIVLTFTKEVEGEDINDVNS